MRYNTPFNSKVVINSYQVLQDCDRIPYLSYILAGELHGLAVAYQISNGEVRGLIPTMVSLSKTH